MGFATHEDAKNSKHILMTPRNIFYRTTFRIRGDYLCALALKSMNHRELYFSAFQYLMLFYDR